MEPPIQVQSQIPTSLDHDLYLSPSRILPSHVPFQRSDLFHHPKGNRLYLLRTNHDRGWE
jgi:hypothetical protein